MTDHLDDYILRSIKQGISEPEIKKKLLDMNWDKEKVDQAFVQIKRNAKLRKKRIIIGIINLVIVILALFAIMYISPKSPFNRVKQGPPVQASEVLSQSIEQQPMIDIGNEEAEELRQQILNDPTIPEDQKQTIINEILGES